MESHHEPSSSRSTHQSSYELKIYWFRVFKFVTSHVAGLYGLYLCMRGEAKVGTIVMAYLFYLFAEIGMTAGAHRLWSHRSFKAKLPLRILLMIANCSTFQYTIYSWCMQHRAHHKYSDTDADPHNSSRGFFYSHIGWWLTKQHPDVQIKGQVIECNDVLEDPVIRFQIKYYPWLVLIFCFIVPTISPYYLLGESFRASFFVCAMLKLVVSLNSTFLINSAAHMYGTRPYDKNINPTQNLFVTFWSAGEGFHNYHHSFPWDYAASELGTKWNVTTAFIDFMAMIGQAYDLKTASKDVIHMRIDRTGDGSYVDPDIKGGEEIKKKLIEE